MTSSSRISCLLPLAIAAGMLSTSFALTGITLVNGDFNAGTWNSSAGTVPDGWTSSPPAAGNADGNYGQAAPGTPNLASIAAHLKSANGNYYQQDLSQNNAGLTAATAGEYLVSFKAGYRNDAATSGNITLRVALWNLATHTEICGADQVLADPGVMAGAAANALTPVTVHLSYDPAAFTNEPIGLRFTHTGNLGADIWRATALLDDVSIQPVRDPIIAAPAPATFAANGATQTFSFPFTNTGATQNLAVSGVTIGGTDASYFTVGSFTASVAAGAGGEVPFHFTPAGSGTYHAEFTLASNDLATPSVVVPVTVEVVDPRISLSATSIDFGSLAAHPGSQSRTITITNNGGSAPLEVLDAYFLGGGGGGMTLDPLPGPIAPGASANLTVRFDPGASGGAFGDLLRIVTTAGDTPEWTLPVTAEVASVAGAKPLTLANAGFDAGGWDSRLGTSPQGWTSSKAAGSLDGHYGQNGAAGLTPNLTSTAAHFKAAGGYYEQNLTGNNSGLTASGVEAMVVGFRCGYRNDAATRGDILLRVALWDAANGVEIAGRSLRIADTGVKAGAEANALTAVSLRIAYDATAYTAEPLALRITQLEPALTADVWRATAILDDVTASIDGDFTPSTGYAAWATASGLTAANSAPTLDPDQDGVTNFDEFAFGGQPLSAASRSLVAVTTADTDANGRKELILTLAVRAGAAFTGTAPPTATVDGVTYAIQGGTDLAAFATAVEAMAAPVVPASLPATPPAGYEYRSFRLSGSDGLAGRGFLRASASP